LKCFVSLLNDLASIHYKNHHNDTEHNDTTEHNAPYQNA
jgi:hypothetical protein